MSLTCLDCGHVNQLDAIYCDVCGLKLHKVTSEVDSSSQILKQMAIAEFLASEEFEEIVVKDENISTEFFAPESGNSKERDVPSTQSKIPVSNPTRLELPNEDDELIFCPSSTGLETVRAVLIDKKTGYEFKLPLKEKAVYIGRVNDEIPVQIDLSILGHADVVSRIHAVIHVNNETYFLEDAGSTNGTWLNEEKVPPGARFRKQLKSGDSIGFGRNQVIKLTFELL